MFLFVSQYRLFIILVFVRYKILLKNFSIMRAFKLIHTKEDSAKFTT